MERTPAPLPNVKEIKTNNAYYKSSSANEIESINIKDALIINNNF